MQRHSKRTETVPAQPTDVIEGSFRVVATRDAPKRPSPNRQREVARIVFWNVAMMAAVVALPILL